MVPTATTVGGYLQSLPNERRVSMARVCSMIRRSARGVRESMRFGLAFYELDGPVFAVESRDRSLVFYFAEAEAAQGLSGPKARGLDIEHRKIIFPDLNCLPLDVVESIVRNSLKLRRGRTEDLPTQAELLEIWEIKEEDAAVAPPIVRIVVNKDEDTEES